MVDVVQLVEHRIVFPSVVGSSPIIHPLLQKERPFGAVLFSYKSVYICSMKKISLIITALLLVMGCQNRDNNFRNGDLIFVGLPADYDAEADSMDAAISSATGEAGELNLIHVAILEVKADSTWVIDATIKRGVDRHPLDTFLKDFTLRDGSYPEFIFKRVEGIDADAAVERTKSLCGRQYDVRFLPENEDLYCTELVQESYLDDHGKPIFQSEPMNWLAPDGTMPPYWVWLFSKLGMDVPQGVLGTNPQKMSQSPFLK